MNSHEICLRGDHTVFMKNKRHNKQDLENNLQASLST